MKTFTIIIISIVLFGCASWSLPVSRIDDERFKTIQENEHAPEAPLVERSPVCGTHQLPGSN